MATSVSAHTVPAPTASGLLNLLASMSRLSFGSFEEAVEAYLSAAARIAGVRSAFVGELDSTQITILGSWNDGGCAIPSEGSLPLEDVPCHYVRVDAAPVAIEDTAADARVRNLPVLRDLGIRAYLGVPLLREDGTVLGSFCTVDPEPRTFSEEQQHALVILAAQLVRLFEREMERCTTLQAAEKAAQTLGGVRGALEEQDLLLRTVAHDVRTPLTSIRGYTDLIQAGLFGTVNEQQGCALDKIGTSARFLHRLVNDLLDLGEAEHGSLVLRTERYRPDALANTVYELSSVQADERGLRLEVAVPALPEVVGDPTRVQQLLLNLLSNALSYTERGSVTLSAGLCDDRLEFEVADTGPGIAPEVLPSIWELGRRGTGKGDGRGLGLYLVRRLAVAMGGSVDVASELGVGSTFTVRLPLELDRPRRVALR